MRDILMKAKEISGSTARKVSQHPKVALIIAGMLVGGLIVYSIPVVSSILGPWGSLAIGGFFGGVGAKKLVD